ncbi:MAG: hypothetical protein ACI8QZ_004111, partial [Chlamydiales bacterium]
MFQPLLILPFLLPLQQRAAGARTPQAPAGTQAALETLPGESDGPLGPALATALDGRDRIDGA